MNNKEIVKSIKNKRSKNKKTKDFVNDLKKITGPDGLGYFDEVWIKKNILKL